MWEIGNYKLDRWYAIYSCTLYAQMSTMEVTDVKVIRTIFSFLMMLFLFYKKGALFCKSPKKLLNNCFSCFRHCYCHFHSHCLCMNACDCIFMCACLCHCHCLCIFVGRVKSRHHSDLLSGRTHISRSSLQLSEDSVSLHIIADLTLRCVSFPTNDQSDDET